MASISSVKKEEMNEDDSIENLYQRLCLDLNMDSETGMDGWRSYLDISKDYYLEGQQIHWLAVSLYVSCRKNKFRSKSSSSNNPISISRLLKSANDLKLLIFFDKLKKWIDMENLPDSLRKQIEEIEYSFNISSIIFQKYFQIFLQIFGGNEQKLNEFNYSEQRKLIQINPKLNHLYKQMKFSNIHLYQLIWTIYSLTKTIYPSTSNDLIASFHLLMASFTFISILILKSDFKHLIKPNYFHQFDDQTLIIQKFSQISNCSSEMINVIYQEYLINGLFKQKNFELFNEKQCFHLLNEMNNQYDEIVLTNCIIDQRIFLENKSQLNDLLNTFNENRNCKSQFTRTPLTSNQYLQTNSNLILTPISQANQLIDFLNQILQDQLSSPSNQLIQLIGEKPFIDHLEERIQQWEQIFISKYYFNDNIEQLNEQISYQTPKYRFDFSLKLFYFSLEKIINIEKSRLAMNQSKNAKEIPSTFHKLILNNEFLKSLLGLCLLLIFYGHSDDDHDLNWILNIYSLHGYSFLKIIQIFLKSLKEMNQSRSFIKYLSSCEETILSSMVFSNHSPLWNEIQTKGILSYDEVSNQTFHSPSNQQSPNSNSVKRKLFSNQTSNELTIIRSRSDPIVEMRVRKCSPYTMFYRKLYQLVLSRLNLICLRLFGSESNQFEKIVWKFFLFLFSSYTEILFRSRDLDQILLAIIYYSANSNLFHINKDKQSLTWFTLIQAYKAIPNAKLKTLRSVFIRSNDNQQQFHFNQRELNENPSLTPSKPAGTIRIIDGNIFGDISSFYSEVFLKIENLEINLEKYLNDNRMIDLPKRKIISNNFNEQFSIHCGENIFVQFSPNQIPKSSFSTSNEINNHLFDSYQNNSSKNILSSSIQAGLNNRVQTTRTRTEDGKFLTTISTIPKIVINSNCSQSKTTDQLTFGQSTLNQSFKRILEQDSNSLTSLTKKVLQIENDRQAMDK